jgi:hypothetical protein
LLHFGTVSLLVSALLLILRALVKRPDPRLDLRDRPRKAGQLTSDEGYVRLVCHFRPEVYDRWAKSAEPHGSVRLCLKLTHYRRDGSRGRVHAHLLDVGRSVDIVD